jgi:hypothetical protein
VNALSRSTAAEAATWWVVLVVIYLATLTTVTLPEVVAALSVGFVCAIVAVAARWAMGASWRPPKRLIQVALLVPVAVVNDSVRVLALLARPRILRRTVGGLNRIRLPQERAALSAGRQALGGLLVSTAPSSVLVDDDPRAPNLVVHRLLDGRPDLAGRVQER